MYGHPQLAIAMCQALDPVEGLALCFELPDDGSVPEWIELIPAGERVAGIDGREWINDKPEGVLDYFQALQSRGRDLPIDWEHSTELKAPKGEQAPAAAWGKELQIRDGGAIWARVDWNESGRNSVASREYRYISPVLLFERNTGRIVGIRSVGLTNNPNLHLTALNREVTPASTDDKETDMKLSEAIRKALNLAEDATEEQAIAAINQMQSDRDTALNQAQQPPLDKFVPRADYDTALNRASTAEQKLQEKEKADQEAEIETAINQALQDGKITPATVEYHKAACREEGGLERFQEYVKAAPTVGDDTNLDDKNPGKQDKALNAEQEKVASMFGNTAEDLSKYATDAA